MANPVRRFWSGVYLLIAILVASVVGFRLIAGYGWLESVWTVVVTFSTVGFAERPSQPPAVQWLTIFLIVGGVTAFANLGGVLVRMMLDGELGHHLRVRRLNQLLSGMKQHVIVCGFGRLGEDLVRHLLQRGIPCAVIDREEQPAREEPDERLVVLQGDATQEEVLIQAGIGRAHAIVCALPGDADNVFVALTARNLSPEIQIVSRAESPSSCRKLRQAGASKIVMPHHSAAQQMERMITRPGTVELLETLTEATGLGIEFDELEIAEASPLCSKQIHECLTRANSGLLLVAIRRHQGELAFNPPLDTVLHNGDSVLVIGAQAEVGRFRQQWKL